jgi:hypothetical protein
MPPAAPAPKAPVPIAPTVAPNRAYVGLGATPDIENGLAPVFVASYVVITPKGECHEASITMILAYNCAAIRTLVTNAIQAQENDDNLEVIYLF